MAKRLGPMDRDWVHGDMRGTWAEARIECDNGYSISAYGFGKSNTWTTVRYRQATNDYSVHLFANRHRDERETTVADLDDVPRVLREFGHPTGNARWYWSIYGDAQHKAIVSFAEVMVD